MMEKPFLQKLLPAAEDADNKCDISEIDSEIQTQWREKLDRNAKLEISF